MELLQVALHQEHTKGISILQGFYLLQPKDNVEVSVNDKDVVRLEYKDNTVHLTVITGE